MSVDENVALMKRWFREVWNEGRVETVYELLDPNAVAFGQTGGGEKTHGPKEFEGFMKTIRSAFPDITTKVEDAFGAGDRVVLRWSATMTHKGHGLGVPPTAKQVQVTGITIARIVDGKILEGWDNWDKFGMLQQVGVLPDLQLKKSA